MAAGGEAIITVYRRGARVAHLAKLTAEDAFGLETLCGQLMNAKDWTTLTDAERICAACKRKEGEGKG